jgi:hypothetical protein
MKKSISLILVLAMCLFLCVPAYAAEMEGRVQNVTSMSEIEYIEQLQSMTNEELAKAGISEDEAEEIYSFNYKDALYERAQLSESQLAGLGYSDKQIKILKEFAANPDGEYDFTALSATLYGTITLNGYSSSYRDVTYNWQWSSAPLWAYDDYVAVRWIGVDSSSHYIDLICDPGDRSTTVNYYDFDSGYFAYSVTDSTTTSDQLNNSFYITFPSTDYYYGSTVWAKSGSINCILTAGGSESINYIYFQGTYGYHFSSLSVTVSYSGTYSVSFVPTTRIQSMPTSARITTYVIYQ